MRLQTQLLSLVTVSTASLLLSACSGGSGSPAESEGEILGKSFYDVNKFSAEKLVCNPMGGDVPTTDNGLRATLYYLTPGQPRYTNVMDYINNGVQSEQYLFYSEVNVPTRLFTAGFPRQIGGVVTDDDGSDLIEYFALKFTSNLKLDSADEEGLYQVAVLSDDGAVLNEITSAGASVIVNNDGNHPTRFGCGSRVLSLQRGRSIPIELNYYQGPRHHIATTLMWRKVSSVDAALDASCGLTGNDTFFDANNNSAVKPAYTALLSRGWKPMKQTNFSIKESSGHNPCAAGLVPVITALNVEETVVGTVRVTWTTDIPATSQVRLVNLGSGAETVSASDNNLRTQHSVIVSDLAIGVNYLAQAISISETYGKAFSTGYNFQIQN